MTQSNICLIHVGIHGVTKRCKSLYIKKHILHNLGFTTAEMVKHVNYFMLVCIIGCSERINEGY